MNTKYDTPLDLPQIILSVKERKKLQLAKSLHLHHVVDELTYDALKKTKKRTKKRRLQNAHILPKLIINRTSYCSLSPNLALDLSVLSFDMCCKHIGHKCDCKAGNWNLWANNT